MAIATRPSVRRALGIRTRLVTASTLMLFCELALIRWLGSNVVHLGYFTNFVLLGSFLGIGLGFLLARRNLGLIRWSTVALGVLVLGIHLWPVTIDRSSSDIIFFTSLEPSGPPMWVALPVIFAAVGAVLLGPAEVVAQCFQAMSPLEAYRWDLLGSLAGVIGFTGMSLVRAPSIIWGLFIAVALIALWWPRPPLIPMIAVTVMLITLALESATSGVSWSPYYKIALSKRTEADGSVGYGIAANGVPHQAIRSAAARLAAEPQYGMPYQRLQASNGQGLDRVLIVGAGSGSDVAIALAKGARHVDAVEIDPRLLQIGRDLHPDHPYADPRVTTIVNDGRAYLEGTHATYDLILFALPDSLALVTGASSIRLESYLFTEQALVAARRHLTPSGGFAMYNYYREDWLIDRLAGTAATAFGHEPCVDRVGRGGGQAVVSVSLNPTRQSCSTASPAIRPAASRVAPATDDRPFLYLSRRQIPAMYLFTILAVLLVSLFTVRMAAGSLRRTRPFIDLFFMGAAFLLLETKNVTTFALLFGTTWLVNAMVFGGVLVSVLLAVETTRWLYRRRSKPLSLSWLFAGVVAALAVAYAVPNSAILGLPFAFRLMVAVVIAFAPVFIANIAFATRFAETEDSPTAFGVNVLGAMAGGCLEYVTLMTGYRALLIVAGVLYLAAFIFRPRRYA
jgi:hypothetical protein